MLFYFIGGKIERYIPNEPIKANLSSVIINFILINLFDTSFLSLPNDALAINFAIIVGGTIFFNSVLVMTFDLLKTKWYIFPLINFVSLSGFKLLVV